MAQWPPVIFCNILILFDIAYYFTDRNENDSTDLDKIKEAKDLLDYIDKKYLLYNNIVVLQGFFLACKIPNLFDRCMKYAKTRGEEMLQFEQEILRWGKRKISSIVSNLQIPGLHFHLKVFFQLKY